jgi:TonB family protein
MSAWALLAPWVAMLGWCLLHFVWQAAAIGVVYVLLRAALPRGNPRYLAALLALLAMAACPVVTAWHEWAMLSAPAVPVVAMVAATVTAQADTQTTTWQALLAVALPWLVLAWALGVAVLGVRVYRQWRGLRRLLAIAERLPAWQARAQQFAARMGLRRVVPVLASVRVATPTLIGWVRPAVVLPLAVLARMPAAQIDLILAHELAHLKRFDHVANLFQVVLETLFFYHPVVHWISRDARNERELCCDALALDVTGGERRDFVAALAGLEEFRAAREGLALAASGGVLVERAWFIAGGMPRRRHQRLLGHVLTVLTIAVLATLGGLWLHNAAWQQRTAALVAASNASILQQVRQDAVMPLSWRPSAASRVPLPPLAAPHLVVDVPAAMDDVTARVRVAPAMAMTLAATDLDRQLAPIAPAAFSAVPDAGAVLVAAPRALHTVAPVYPPVAQAKGVQGQVVVEFALSAAGVPQDLAIAGAGNGQFDAAALRALSQWRFTPPAAAGRRYRQTFAFRLDAAEDSAEAQACRISTGSHICRQVFDADAGVRVVPPGH